MAVVIAFVSQKGGVGKSTLARALAAVVAHAGLRVRIADLDPQQSTIAAWQERRGANQIAPAITVISAKSVSSVLSAAPADELLLLDTPAGGGRLAHQAAVAAHLVVVPSGTGLDDLRPTVLFLHELAAAGITPERMVVALCRTASDDEEAVARAYIQEAGYAVLAGSIPERSSYRDAHNAGQAITETKQRPLRERAEALMDALFARVAALLESDEVRRQHE